MIDMASISLPSSQGLDYAVFRTLHYKPFGGEKKAFDFAGISLGSNKSRQWRALKFEMKYPTVGDGD